MALPEMPWELVEMIVLQDTLSFSDVKSLLAALAGTDTPLAVSYSKITSLWEKKFRRLHPYLLERKDKSVDSEDTWWEHLEEWRQLEEHIIAHLPKIRHACFVELLSRMDDRKDNFISWLLEADPIDRCYMHIRDQESLTAVRPPIIAECVLNGGGEFCDENLVLTRAFEFRSSPCFQLNADRDRLFYSVPSFSNQNFTNMMGDLSQKQLSWAVDVHREISGISDSAHRSLEQYARIGAVHIQKISSRDEVVRILSSGESDVDLELLLKFTEACFPSFVQLKSRILIAGNTFIEDVKRKTYNLPVEEQATIVVDELNAFWLTSQGEPLRVLDTLLARFRLLWQHNILENPVPAPIFSFYVICKLMELPVTFAEYIYHFDNTSMGEFLLPTLSTSTESDAKHVGCCVPIKTPEGVGALRWIRSPADNTFLSSYVSSFFALRSDGILAEVRKSSLVNQLGKWVLDFRKQKEIRNIKEYGSVGLTYHHELCLRLRPTNQPNIENYSIWLKETRSPINVDIQSEVSLLPIQRSCSGPTVSLVPPELLNGTGAVLPVGSVVKYLVDSESSDTELYGVIVGRTITERLRATSKWFATYHVIPIRSSDFQEKRVPHGMNVIKSVQWISHLPCETLQETDDVCWLFFDAFDGCFFTLHSALTEAYPEDEKLKGFLRPNRSNKTKT